MSKYYYIISVLTIVAILIAPLFPVILNRRHEAKARKLEIYRTLMQTRMNPSRSEHIEALNLIETEFPYSKNKEIFAAWENYRDKVKKSLENNQDESQKETNIEEARIAHAELLTLVAKSLNQDIDPLKVYKGNIKTEN